MKGDGIPLTPASIPFYQVRRLAAAQQIREVTVAQPVERVGALAQGAEQLEAFAEGFRHMVGLQGARLIESGRAAQARCEIIEIDEKIVPALFAGGGGLDGD